MADRVVKLAEDEAAHRRLLETKVVETQSTDLYRKRTETRCGQFLAFGVVLVGVGGCCLATVQGYPKVGAIIFTLLDGPIVAAFLYGRWDERKKPKPQFGPPDPQRDLTKPDPPSLESMARPDERGALPPPATPAE